MLLFFGPTFSPLTKKAELLVHIFLEGFFCYVGSKGLSELNLAEDCFCLVQWGIILSLFLASICCLIGRTWIDPFWTCSVPIEKFRHGFHFQKLYQKSYLGGFDPNEHPWSCQRLAQQCWYQVHWRCPILELDQNYENYPGWSRGLFWGWRLELPGRWR